MALCINIAQYLLTLCSFCKTVFVLDHRLRMEDWHWARGRGFGSMVRFEGCVAFVLCLSNLRGVLLMYCGCPIFVFLTKPTYLFIHLSIYSPLSLQYFRAQRSRRVGWRPLTADCHHSAGHLVISTCARAKQAVESGAKSLELYDKTYSYHF